MKRLLAVLAVVGPLTVMLGAACDSSRPAPTTPPVTSAVSSEQAPAPATQVPVRDLGEPKTSGVEGLPVPSSAIKVDYSGPPLIRSDVLELWKVPGATGDALVSWYHQHVPMGQDWRGWSWCEFKGRNASTQWYWMRGTKHDLMLLVVPQDNPPGMVLAAGEALEPC